MKYENESISEYINTYEHKKYGDSGFLITFHRDRLHKKGYETHNEKNIKNNMSEKTRVHWHEALEILRVKSGNCIVHYGMQSRKISKGDIFVVNANELHKLEAGDTPCVYECLAIDYKSCLNWGFDIYDYTYAAVPKSEQLDNLMDKIECEYFSGNKYYKLIVNSCCMQIMAYLTRDFVDETAENDIASKKKSQLVKQSIQYIMKNYTDDNILEKLSLELKYNRFYIAHIFTDFTGMSVKEYQLEVRFSNAKKLLCSSNMSVLEIAEALGYHACTSFSAAFKKQFGMTPTQYKYQKALR